MCDRRVTRFAIETSRSGGRREGQPRRDRVWHRLDRVPCRHAAEQVHAVSGTPIPKAKDKKKVRSQKSWRNLADKLFMQLIRELHNWRCERCGSEGPLETSHVFTRDYAAVRCDPMNATLLCSSCHRWWHDRPLDAAEWLYTVRPMNELLALSERAHAGVKVDWEQIVLDLREQLKQVA